MELDELKYQLNNRLSTDHTGRTATDIAALLTRKTISITDKLKKNLLFEIYSCLIVSIGFGVIGWIATLNSLRIYFSVFTLLSIAFMLILIYLLRRIKNLTQASALPVKSNLQTIVVIIEEFTRRYFQFTMALIPVCFLFALFLGLSEKQATPKVDGYVKQFASWQVFLFAGIYMVLLAVGVYYFTKWYLKKLYGKYVIRLKDCIEELESA